MKKLLSLFLVLALMMTAMTFTSLAEGSYTASDWAKAELAKAEEMGLIPASLLNEDLTKPITRAEFAAVSVLLFEKISLRKAEKAGTNPFTDTTDEYVLKALELGVTTGTSATTFDPDALLTREQAAAMLTRVYKKLTINGWNISKDSEFKLEYTAPANFADDSNISAWAKDSVYFMAAKSIINGVGDNNFAPQNNASREQAIIIATRMTGLEYVLADGIATLDPSEEVREEPEIPVEKETFTIGYIGGSLTEGGSAWMRMTKLYLEEKMPDKEIVTINAGKGGTRSNYGAARFMEDIGQYNPDLVFIEFSVNDCGNDYETYSAYAESMLRQCLSLPKVPAVIFLHAPHASRVGDFSECVETMAAKDRVAVKYGAGIINAHDYLQREYNRVKKEKGYKTYEEYLATIYKMSGSKFDNHAGYDKYGEAIIEAFEKDGYETYLTPIKDNGYLNTSQRSIIDAKYSYIYTNDPRMQYSGNWKTYYKYADVPTYDNAGTLSSKFFSYPYFPNGIKQITNEKAAIRFTTSAKSIALNYNISPKGMDATVYVGNQEVGKFTTSKVADKINYMSNWVTLPGDGKTHTVTIILDEPTDENYIFRFGAIIERN